ncbi:MAG: chemotaxis protein CheC [Nitrosopumilus sp.]|nr:chemotaxis protein CheC [Nitrosopumilus sp.]
MPELTQAHLDTLKEVCNIGINHAKTALSQLLDTPINFAVPIISQIHIHQIQNLFEGKKTTAGYSTYIRGDSKGAVMLVFPFKDAVTLSKILSKELDGTSIKFEVVIDNLKEITNILAGSALNAIAKFLKMNLYESPPNVHSGIIEQIVIDLEKEFGHDSEALVMQIDMTTQSNKSITGYLFLIFPKTEIDIILDKIEQLSN